MRPDAQREAAVAAAVEAAATPQARETAAGATPGAADIEVAAEKLARSAVTPCSTPALRRRILELQRQNEQTIDRHTLDEVLYAGFDAQAVARAQAKVADFRTWIDAHRDELTALQLLPMPAPSLCA